MRRTVVLPEPLGPSSVRNSPSRMSRSTPSTAWTASEPEPKVLRRSRRRTAGSVMAGESTAGSVASDTASCEIRTNRSLIVTECVVRSRAGTHHCRCRPTAGAAAPTGPRAPRWPGPSRRRPRRPTETRPHASRTQVVGSASTTLGGVPRVCRGPSTHWTAANGGTRTSTLRPGARSTRTSRSARDHQAHGLAGHRPAPPGRARSGARSSACTTSSRSRVTQQVVERDRAARGHDDHRLARRTAARGRRGLSRPAPTRRRAPPGGRGAVSRASARVPSAMASAAAG